MAGLHAGDRVVVDGVLKVVPGQPVKIVEPGAGGAAKAGGAAGTAPQSRRGEEVGRPTAHVHPLLHRPAGPLRRSSRS